MLEINARPGRDLNQLIERIGERAVARELNIHEKTLYRWKTGRVPIPGRHQQSRKDNTMKCTQDCQQGRRCDCDDDMNEIEFWVAWAAGICLTMLLTAVAFAIGGFIWGMFA